MIAILTKYIPPTNHRGSRISVLSGNGHRLMVPWADELDASENHAAAAYALCHKMGWTGTLAHGGLKDGAAHVFIPEVSR